MTGLAFRRRLSECEDEEDANYLLGFALTFVAGMATVLGCLAICCVKGRENPKKITSGALAFAAGVMMYVSFIDVLGGEAPEFFENHFHPPDCARRLHEEEEEEEGSIWIRICVAGFFFVGMVLASGLDKCVDVIFGHTHGGAEQDGSDEESDSSADVKEGGSSLERISLVTFLALSAHNFPEGLATFFGGGSGSFTVPIAIALHNIPEGMAIAVPTYQSSGSIKKAVLNTFLAGLAQPLGAAVGWLMMVIFRLDDLPNFAYGVVYSATAGVMVCVSLMELLPEAFASAPPLFCLYWILGGFVLMEFSIICLDLSGA
jgi:ZIP family zinc transporter